MGPEGYLAKPQTSIERLSITSASSGRRLDGRDIFKCSDAEPHIDHESVAQPLSLIGFKHLRHSSWTGLRFRMKFESVRALLEVDCDTLESLELDFIA